MPEPTSILESITLNVVATLATITIGNGYDYSLTVSREKSRGINPTHLLCIVNQLDPSENDDNPEMMKSWVQPYACQVFCVISEDEEEAVFPDAILNKVGADIAKKLMIDRTRGGFAFDTVIRPSMTWNDVDGSFCLRQFNFEVHYRTLETDPYTQSG